MEHAFSDTDPETARVHLELLRASSPERRLRLAFSLSHTAMSLSMGGVAQGLPGASSHDVVAELLPAHAAPLFASLRHAYYVPEARLVDAIAQRASFNVIHLGTMVKVDVFVSRGRPFDRRALDRVRPAPLEGGGAIPVSSPEEGARQARVIQGLRMVVLTSPSSGAQARR